MRRKRYVDRSMLIKKQFLRLKRTRLGLDDFESLKVIGRGAFGEVSCFVQVTTVKVDVVSCLNVVTRL